jgi:hypothetical protein
MLQRTWSTKPCEPCDTLGVFGELLEKTDTRKAQVAKMRSLSSYLEGAMRTTALLADTWDQNPQAYNAQAAERVIQTLENVVEVLKGKWD